MPDGTARTGRPKSLVAILLTCCAIAVGSLAIRFGSDGNGSFYLFAIAPTVPAAVLLVIVGEFIPNLSGPDGLKFPLPFALPVVYLSLLAMVVVICWNTGDPLIQPTSAASGMLVWLNPGPLLVAYACQALALIGLSRIRR